MTDLLKLILGVLASLFRSRAKLEAGNLVLRQSQPQQAGDLVDPTIDAWAVLGARFATVLLTNYALPRHSIATETIQIKLGNAQPPTQATIRRIDSDHANAKRRWKEMGSPEYLNAAVLAELNAVSRCEPEPHPFDFQDGALGFDVTLPALSVTAVTFRFAARDRG